MRQFSDLDFNFTKNPITNDVVTKYDEDVIKASVKNLVMTKHYERVFQPEIGCQASSILFENFSPMVQETFKQTIFDVINKFEPRVTVLDVVLREKIDDSEIEVDIIFKIKNTEKPVKITTAINRIR